MSAYKVINCLISQPKHEEPSNETVLLSTKLKVKSDMCKKILTILRSKTVFI